MLFRVFVTCVAAVIPTAGLAQLPGPEFRVNTHTTSFQTAPQVASSAAGSFVAAWNSYGQDGSGFGVFAQRYDAAGAPLDSEFQVNTTTYGFQGLEAVAMDADGDFVVIWLQSDGSATGVFGQRFDSSGTAVGSEFGVNTYVAGNQVHSSAAMDAVGNFVVVWTSYAQDGDHFGIFGQRFEAAGSPVGGEFAVNTYTASAQVFPAVAADDTGNFVVAWHGYSEDGSQAVWVRRFTAAGTPVGIEFRVEAQTTSLQAAPAVASDPNGNFVVSWVQADGSDFGIFARTFDANGAPRSSAFQVNAYTSSTQFLPSVAMDRRGSFVAVWRSLEQDGSGEGVYASRFNPFGVRRGAEFRVNTTTLLSQAEPVVAHDRSGNFVVVWQGELQGGQDFDIFAKRYGGLP